MIMRRFIPSAIVVLALLVSVAFTARNATTPDRQPKVVAADSIIGSWVLNQRMSDDPREAMEESQQQRGGGGSARRRGGGGGGGCGGGSGITGRRPRSQGATGRQGSVSPEQRRQIQVSMRAAMRPVPQIEISRTDSTVMLETLLGNRILFTDNREVTIAVTADLDSKVKCKWDKNKLVIESETDAGVKTKYTYEPDGDQLKVKVSIEVRRTRQTIRYELVYDRSVR